MRRDLSNHYMVVPVSNGLLDIAVQDCEGCYLFGVSPATNVGPLVRQCNKPNTATPAVVPTNTLPSATVGVMNLLPAPN